MLRLLTCLFLVAVARRMAEGTIFPAQGGSPYQFSFWQAYQKCAELGASLASPAEVYDAQRQGQSYCSCGWLSDKTSRYPMSQAIASCGGSAGVHHCSWRSNWNAFCYRGNVPRCSQPLGMESRAIQDHQLSTSSAYHTFWNERWAARLARLNQEGIVDAWMPHHDDPRQYIEVDLEEPKAITAIMTQGANRYAQPQYVKKYTLSYSKDGDLWVKYLGQDERVHIFNGNSDAAGQVRNELPVAILAQYIRIYPREWNRHISLRFELFGCSLDQYDRSEALGPTPGVASVQEAD